jgi:hypothetical protein
VIGIIPESRSPSHRNDVSASDWNPDRHRPESAIQDTPAI